MRLTTFARSACLVLAFAIGPVLGDEPPWALTKWSPIAANPVFQGAGDNAWDRKIRERGYILIEDGTYHLWYTGYNDDRAPAKFLGHATSTDGIRWTRDPANPLFTKSWVEDVCVVHRDGTYFLFAEGKDDVAHQMTSPDGVRWTDLGSLDIRKVDGTPIGPGPYGTPTAWFEDGTWYLFYERGDRGVWLATSKDRRTWTNVQDTPVLACGPESYDREAVAMNQVVKRDGVYYAFYHANAHRPWKDWTTNLARSRDLVHWEKYPGNPIIQNNCSSAVVVRTPDGDRLYTMHPDVKAFVSPKSHGDKD
jgi:beta-1,2-mannobiose phosphorylase / 1,2-beta-oligomannan phosphorylase